MNKQTIKGVIIKKIDYPATLMEIPIGETRTYDMVGNIYGCMASAISNLKKRGHDFDFSSDRKTNTLTITRNK